MTQAAIRTTEHALDRDGCVLHATVVPGPGTPVVATSGALGLRSASYDLLQGVAGLRQLVLLEVRGHGTSTCRHPEHYTWASLTDDLLAWLDLLGITRCALVGTSLGGIVSLGAATSGRVVVEQLVLTNTVFTGEGAPVDPQQELALRALASAFGTDGVPTHEQVLDVLGALVPGAREVYALALAGHVDLGSVASYFRLVERGPLPWREQDLRSLDAPVLVVAGRDAVHPPHVSQALAALLPSASLCTAGEPEEVRRAVASLLL